MRPRSLLLFLLMGLIAVAAPARAGQFLLAQASSIEVRKTAPDASPEVLVNGKPSGAGKAAKSEGKPDAKPATKATQKAEQKAKSEPKSGKGFGELRVADRQLTVRAARDKDSEFRKVLHPGQSVRVDFAEDGWFAVFDPDETVRDLKRAWGYSRDKYLVPPKDYVPQPEAPQAAASRAPQEEPAAHAAKSKPESKPAAKADDDAVGYAVIERKADKRHPQHATLRVRLELTQPPAKETLRKIAREIWKAERKKGEELELEVLLTGMDPHGLAYAVAKFHDDGRIREFWWRDVVVGKGHK